MADVQARWRPEYYATFFGCLANHACEHDDDDCVLVATRTAADGLIDLAVLDACVQGQTTACDAIFLGLAADCMKRQRECTDDAGIAGFVDDLCMTIAALNDGQRSQVPGCLARECSAVSACLRGLGTISY